MEEREKEDVQQLLSQIQRQLDTVIWVKDPLKPPGIKPTNRKEVWLCKYYYYYSSLTNTNLLS